MDNNVFDLIKEKIGNKTPEQVMNELMNTNINTMLKEIDVLSSSIINNEERKEEKKELRDLQHIDFSNMDFSNIKDGLSQVGFDNVEINSIMGLNWMEFFKNSFEKEK